ncbi:unnamed protein product [Rotaria sordida]|nr:unnamed protein product [Rotaria sordida]
MHKKLRPNRNWCYFEQCQEIDPSIYTTIKSGFFHRHFGSKKQDSPMIELDPTSKSNDHKSTEPPVQQHTHGPACTDMREIEQAQLETHTLKIRLWLESGGKHNEGRQFANYDLLIPNLI